MNTTTRINPTSESTTNASDCGCGPTCCTPGTSETGNTATTTTYRPAADIAETDAAFTVRLDIPGANADTIDVRVSGNELTISAKVPARTALTEGATPLHREYGVGDFARSFRLGQEIDTANIFASYEQGVLTLTLPKSDRVRARKIDVRVN